MSTTFEPITEPFMHGVKATRHDGIVIEVVRTETCPTTWELFAIVNGKASAFQMTNGSWATKRFALQQARKCVNVPTLV